MDETDYAITMLMSRSKIPMHMTLEPEQVISVDFADLMRKATIEGHYKGIWCHIPNESKRHPLVALLLKAMGMIPGSTDYVFLWDGGGAVIEMKVPERFRIGKSGRRERVAATDLGENQVFFKKWCARAKVHHAVCWSKEEAYEALIRFGAFRT